MSNKRLLLFQVAILQGNLHRQRDRGTALLQYEHQVLHQCGCLCLHISCYDCNISLYCPCCHRLEKGRDNSTYEDESPNFTLLARKVREFCTWGLNTLLQAE